MPKLIKLIFLTLIMTVISSQPIFAEETQPTTRFSILNESHWSFNSIEKLVKAGIITGYPDCTFKPEGSITRAELVKIVNLIYSYTEKQETTNFTDIKSGDWFYEHILVAQNAGYIIGYEDNTFRPNDDITREQLCKIIDSINNLIELPFDNTPSDEVSPWAVGYVNRVLSNRIMLLDENNNFRATENATRAEACDALAKFVIIEDNGTDDSDQPSSNTPGSNTDQELTDQELYDIMDTVIRRLNKGVIPELTSDAQIEIVNDIIANMQKYKTDSTHNYEKAAEKTYDKYKAMSKKEQDELKNLIQLKNTTNDLLELKEFFFPDVDINKGIAMKKPTKILLTILLILIASSCILIYWQLDNISAIINALKYSSDDLASRMDQSREKLKTEVEKYTSSPIKDITSEDEQKLLKGEVTIEEIAEQYGLPIEYMQDIDVDKTANDEKLNDAKNTNEDINIIVTENNKSNEEKIDTAISEGVAKMYALKAKYVNKLGELEREVLKQYSNLPKEKQNADSKYNLVMANIDYVAELEEKCDNNVNEVIKSLEIELIKLNANTEIIQILKVSYEEEKELKKSYYLSIYNE